MKHSSNDVFSFSLMVQLLSLVVRLLNGSIASATQSYEIFRRTLPGALKDILVRTEAVTEQFWTLWSACIGAFDSMNEINVASLFHCCPEYYVFSHSGRTASQCIVFTYGFALVAQSVHNGSGDGCARSRVNRKRIAYNHS